MPVCRSEQLLDLAARALARAGASQAAALSTARALVAAEEQGLASHGISRVPLYAAHARNGRVMGDAIPRIARERGAACLVDACNGFAYPACEMAIWELTRRAREFGIAYVGITNSNHFGATAHHLEPLADAGLVSLAFCNAPASINAWGGKRPLFGTNPIAAAFPRRSAWPVIIDLSLSEVAKGKLMVAAREGKTIPHGWALDRDGRPTTDPQAGMDGSMVPAGGVKGAMLAMTIELLSVALTGAAFAFEAESFYAETGNVARLGQGFIAIDPGALAGSDVYLSRVETLVEMMLMDDGVRLPAYRRFELRQRARQEGMLIPDALFNQISDLAG